MLIDFFRNHFRVWAFFVISLSLQAEPLKFSPKGEAVVLINADTNTILFEKNGSVSYFPASTTKVATALYALKLKGSSLATEISAEQDSLGTLPEETKKKLNYKDAAAYRLEPDGMHIGIKKGEILSLEDLLKGMLIASGNDAANVIAYSLGPTIPTFMEGLNKYLKEIGCQNTHFQNPHGLHAPQHTTTALDLAKMAQEALKNPKFCEIVAQPRFLRPKTNKQPAAALLQTNRLIRPGKFNYPKAIGIKTGYHSKANHTFIGAARSEGRTLIVVLLGYPDRHLLFQEAIDLFELAFNEPKVNRRYLKAGLQSFELQLPKAHQPIRAYLKEPVELCFYPSEDPEAKCFLYWNSLTPPISKEQVLGEVRLIASNGNQLKTLPLFAHEEVTMTWRHGFASHLHTYLWYYVVGAVFIIGCFLFTLFIRRE